MRFRLSIRTKLLFSFLLVLLVSYSILLYSTIRNVNASLEDKIDKDLEANLRFAKDQYWSRANQSRFALIQPATSPYLQQAIIRGDTAFLGNVLHRLQTNLSFIDISVIADSRHKVLARGSDTEAGECLRLFDIFEEAARRREPVISTELVSNRLLCRNGAAPGRSVSAGESMVVVVAVPILSKGGAFLGCIIAGDIINRDPHVAYQVRQIFGKELEVTIAQRGTRIASSLADDGGEAAALPPGVLAYLKKGLPYRGEAMIGGRLFKTVIEPVRNLRGEYVGSLSVALSMEDFKRIRLDNLRNIMVSAITGILLSFCIAYVASRRLTDPLLEFSRAAGEIEQGRLRQRMRVGSSDEFEKLADTFNKMADSLEERDATIRNKTFALGDVNRRLRELNEVLEGRVAERTAELEMGKSRLEAILASMAEAVVVTDRDNRIILFNPAAQRIFEIKAFQVEGNTVEQICESGGFCGLAVYLREMRADAENAVSREEEVEVRGKKLKINLSPLFDDRLLYAGTVMSVRDVTVEEEVDRMKTEFISTVSHELKTPLTSIKGSLQFIMQKGQCLNNTERELLRVCSRNTDRLIRLISDILDISKIESGKMEFVFKPQSIYEMISYSVEELGAFAANRRVDVRNEMDRDLPPVCADHDRIIQVINNLLANAIKFSPEGDAVTIGARREENLVAVSVTNKGQVIEAADRDKLFRKFQKLNHADHRDRGGTGLGLAISKEIVERHHGRISYFPVNDGGNVFMFTLPVYEEKEP